MVIAGGINIAAAWIASVLLDGFQSDWHEHSVPGQILAFERDGRPLKSDGWYVVPGKVEPVVWTLPALFLCTLGFLVWFGSLG